MDEIGFPFPGSFSSRNYGLGTDGIEEEEVEVEGGKMAEIAEDGEEVAVVHVAVGKSIEKSVDLLHWTFRRFGKSSVVLLHVHQPSSTVPTPLGRLPAAQANEKLLSVYRREERKESMNLLSNYLSICFRAKVKASIIAIEDVQVQKGIVELVNMHGIRKLVMGAAPFNCMKVRKSSSKAKYASKRAPPFCEILFVNKGKHVWTREASEGSSILPQMLTMPETTKTDILRLKSSHNYENEHFYPIAGFSPHPPIRLCASNGNWNMVEIDELEVALSTAVPSSNSFSSESACYSIGSTEPSELDLKVEEESLHNQILDIRAEAEALKNEAFAELLKRRRLESEALEAINRMKTFEAAHSREVNHRKEVEDRLAITRREQENLMEQKEQISKKLQRAMRNVAFLDIRAREAMRRQDEAARELGLIQTSLATLRHEKQNINRQKEEATQQLEWWKSQWQTGPPNGSCYSSVDPLVKFTEYSLSDLQAATCNFSESFKIGQGEHGCVYKGEILDRCVVIKKLHPPNMQGRLEFQQEVQRLSKLQHPHLVSLIGACPEALSLVFDYMPNGSIQDHLFSRTNRDPLTWKTRTRIAAEISSALLYLHSCSPEKIVHGNLKPENILLDSESKCKLGDFGIFRLIPEETARCPSFRGTSETKSAFPYTDPEVQRSRHLRPESDIYSFGVIILQLLTGRPPFGLASEVRQALLGGNLASMLDPTAGDWPMFVATRLVELGLQCCEVNGRDRPMLTPTMVRELEQLHRAEERPVPSFFLCPILQEIMYDPHLAADGFTYEAEALRGWLKNGRETSPMTNLKLSHLHLTPNHALRLAIQVWLCQS